MWIMVSGPYRSGSNDPGVWRGRLEEMNRAALELFRAGHVPVIGVNAALPLIETAGASAYDAIMMPLSLALTARCDGVLRIGGPSEGADEEVATFVRRGLPVFRSIAEVPPAGGA